MATNSSNYWVKFFISAGLPSSVATKYAIIFTDHRIQENMLKDLTKDMLYDMGIKTMGDVIAILRQAKEVIEENTKIQLLGNEPIVNNLANTKAKAKNLSSNTSASKLEQPLKRAISETTQEFKPLMKRIVTTSSISKTVSDSKIIVPTNSKIERKVTFPSQTKIISLNSAQKSNQAEDLSKVSVFQRLGSVNESKTSLVRSNQMRKVTLASDKKTVNIRDRLGVKGVKGVKTVNPRLVNTNPTKQMIMKVNSKTQAKSNRINTVSLKKSIFDRLGPMSF